MTQSNDTIRSTPDPLVALREALGVALSVALHEYADPDCSGDPPYDVTHERAAAMADQVMRGPIVQRALAALDSIEEGSREDEDEIMQRLSSDNPKSRHHREERADGWSAWTCIPVRDVIEVRAAALAAASPSREGAGLDVEAIREWIAERAVYADKYPAGTTAIDAEELDAYLARLASEEQREDGPAGNDHPQPSELAAQLEQDPNFTRLVER